MMKRLLGALWLFAAITIAITSHTQAAEPVKIAIVSRTVFYVPAWIAERKGFFAEEGLQPEIKIYDNAEAIDADLRGGAVQVSISTPESVVMDVYRGGSLRIIAGNAERLPHFIITKKDISSIGGLRGARIGVLSLKEGTTYLVKKIAQAAGLGVGDYEILAVGGAPTRWRLLKEGKIDAGLQPFPLSYEAAAAGFNNLGPVLDYVPHYQFTSVNVDSRWAEANSARVAAVLRALQRGQTYAAAHPDEAAEIAAAELKTTPELARRALGDASKMRILSSDLSVSREGLQAVFEGLRAAELLPTSTTFDFGRIVDERYLTASRAAR